MKTWIVFAGRDMDFDVVEAEDRDTAIQESQFSQDSINYLLEVTAARRHTPDWKVTEWEGPNAD